MNSVLQIVSHFLLYNFSMSLKKSNFRNSNYYRHQISQQHVIQSNCESEHFSLSMIMNRFQLFTNVELRNAIISTVVPPAVIESGSSAPSADSSTSQTEPYSIRMLRAVQNCFAHMLGCEVKAYTPDDIWANIRYAFSNSYSREKLRNCYNYSSITLLENSKFVERFVFCKETRFSFTSIFTTVCSESTVRAR